MKNNASKYIVVVAVIIATLAIYCILTYWTPPKPMATQQDYLSKEAQVSVIGGNFTLKDTNGEVFTQKKLRGKTSLLYFGFSFCPDICPAALSKIEKVLIDLDKFNIEVTPIFISVDHERDNPLALKKLLKNYDKRIIGLSGTKKQVEEVANNYKIYYASEKESEDDKFYMINHSSFIYLINKNGQYQAHFPLATNKEQIVENIRQLINVK